MHTLLWHHQRGSVPTSHQSPPLAPETRRCSTPSLGTGADRCPLRWAPLPRHGGGHQEGASEPDQHVEATVAALPLAHPRLQRALGPGEPSRPDHPHPAGLGSPCGWPQAWVLPLPTGTAAGPPVSAALPPPALLPCCPGIVRAGVGCRATVGAAGGEGVTASLLPLPVSFPHPGKATVLSSLEPKQPSSGLLSRLHRPPSTIAKGLLLPPWRESLRQSWHRAAWRGSG